MISTAQQIHSEAQARLRRYGPMFGESVIRTMSPQSYASIDDIQAWLDAIENARVAYDLSEAQLNWRKMKFGAGRAEIEEYARAKSTRIYRTGDELPAYADRVATKTSERGNLFEVRRINKRHYICKNGKSIGMNPSNNTDHTMRRYLGWCWNEENAACRKYRAWPRCLQTWSLARRGR